MNCIADPYFTYPRCINSYMQEGTVIQSTKEIQDNSEHKRRLLLEILKERGIIFDLETKKIIDDRTSLETLLRVLQIEKEREIKKKKHHEAPCNTDKSSGMEMHSYESVYDSGYLVYRINLLRN